MQPRILTLGAIGETRLFPLSDRVVQLTEHPHEIIRRIVCIQPARTVELWDDQTRPDQTCAGITWLTEETVTGSVCEVLHARTPAVQK